MSTVVYIDVGWKMLAAIVVLSFLLYVALVSDSSSNDHSE